VPAAAVIHEWQTLSVIIGRKECVDGKRNCVLLKWLIGVVQKLFT